MDRQVSPSALQRHCRQQQSSEEAAQVKSSNGSSGPTAWLNVDVIIHLFCSWLREWKLRTDREERRKQTEKKQGEDKNGGWQEYCSSLCLFHIN